MEQTKRSKVFLTSASNRAEGIKRLLEEFDLDSEGTIALKANYNSDDPFPGTTHIDTLCSLVEGSNEIGSFRITMAERSGMGITGEVLENRGVFDLSEKLGFRVIDLDLADAEDWKDIPCRWTALETWFQDFSSLCRLKLIYLYALRKAVSYGLNQKIIPVLTGGKK